MNTYAMVKRYGRRALFERSRGRAVSLPSPGENAAVAKRAKMVYNEGMYTAEENDMKRYCLIAALCLGALLCLTGCVKKNGAQNNA